MVVAAGVAVIALTTTTESRAGGEEEFVKVTCSGGDVTAVGKAPWHTNAEAPWKWDKGEKLSVNGEVAKFKGAKCEGTIKAYVCNGDQCKGPIFVPVH
ncbi:MAG: hypothetical protein KIT84_26685 [Labilithrix sp.]|nr:hypothetical protein [Labilithrix sp.]MCW5814641.1 hypothetical protein [Labilithrix sp.]